MIEEIKVNVEFRDTKKTKTITREDLYNVLEDGLNALSERRAIGFYKSKAIEKLIMMKLIDISFKDTKEENKYGME